MPETDLVAVLRGALRRKLADAPDPATVLNAAEKELDLWAGELPVQLAAANVLDIIRNLVEEERARLRR